MPLCYNAGMKRTDFRFRAAVWGLMALITAWLVLSSSARAEGGERVPKNPPPPKSPSVQAEGEGRKWALLIGIDQYRDVDHINGLGGAVADAKALKNVLVSSLGFPDDPEHIRLLLNADATKSDILGALTRLKASVKEGDLVFVFYAGHGIEVNGAPYLLPYETNAISDEDLTDTALPAAKFQERLRVLKAKMLFLCFDMCRRDPLKVKRDAIAGNELKAGTVRGMDFAQAVGKGFGPSLVVTLYSCSPDERAFEDRLRSRGFFSEYLEKGLSGEAADASGSVTVQSLTDYLTAQVPAAVARAENGQKQTPYPIPAGPGATAFILTSSASSPVAPAKVTKKDLKARLRVTTNAPNATVTVDGSPVTDGSYTVSLPDTEKKTVTVKVRAEGYEPFEGDVELIRGKLVPVTATLDKMAEPVKPVKKPVENAVVPPQGNINTLSLTAPRTIAEYKAQMVTIPGGTFTMGADDLNNDEKPPHQVTLSAFKMGRTLVTVSMWKQYCKAMGKSMPKAPSWGWIEDHPMLNVSWEDIAGKDGKGGFCKWAGLALPTEAQFEYAAKGGQNVKWPWGDTFDEDKLVWYKNSTNGTAPVIRRDRVYVNRYGLVDMGGNVWQWCADWYGPYNSNAVTAPRGASSGDNRVMRGGAWGDADAVNFRCAFRLRYAPTSRDYGLGFRCVALSQDSH